MDWFGGVSPAPTFERKNVEHLDFIVWMIGFPIGWEIAEWIRSMRAIPEKECGDSAKGFAAVIVVALWLGIGGALW